MIAYIKCNEDIEIEFNDNRISVLRYDKTHNAKYNIIVDMTPEQLLDAVLLYKPPKRRE